MSIARLAPPRFSRTIWIGGLLGLLAGCLLALHGPVLRWPFISDDYIFLSRSRRLGDLFSAFIAVPNYFRPVGRELYFFAGYHVFGNHPLAFHLLNFGLLVLTLGLVLALVTRLAGSRAGALAAIAYALMYAHRVQMAWVSCSQDLNATALALWTVLLLLDRRPRGSALAFFLALLSKESVVLLPLVLAIWLALVETKRASVGDRVKGGLAGTAWLWAAVAVWATVVLIVRFSQHAWLQNSSTPVADVSLNFADFGAGYLSALLAYLYVDQPWNRLLDSVLSTRVPWVALALVVAAAVLAVTAPRSTSEEASHNPSTDGLRAGLLGCSWAVVGALPIGLVGHHFSAYYVSFSAVGAAILFAAVFSGRARFAVVPLLAVATFMNVAANGVGSFRATRAPTTDPGASFVTYSRLELEQAYLDSFQVALRVARPPRGAVIYLSRAPHFSTIATASGLAPQIWFDDPTLETSYVGSYRPGAESRPRVFLRFDAMDRSFDVLPESLVVASLAGEEALARGSALEARAHFERALALATPGPHDVERADLENGLGVAADQLGDSAAARKAWLSALGIREEHRGALLNLAGLEAERGDYAAARARVVQVLAKSAGDRTAMEFVFRIDLAARDSAAAQRDWEAIAARYPGLADTLVNRFGR